MNAIKNEAQEKIGRARTLQSFFTHPGWKLYEEELNTQMLPLIDIEKITTLKELEKGKGVKQVFKRVKDNLLSDILAADEAQEVLQKLE